MPFYNRKPTRIPGYNYAAQNYYFITICTDQKKCLFGKPDQLNVLGNIATYCIKQIEEVFSGVYVDKFVVMPNHIHAIIVLSNEKEISVSTVIGQFKAAVTKNIRKEYPAMVVWQRSFHDHIIRNVQGYQKIWEYIETNPIKWEEDCFYQKDN